MVKKENRLTKNYSNSTVVNKITFLQYFTFFKKISWRNHLFIPMYDELSVESSR